MPARADERRVSHETAIQGTRGGSKTRNALRRVAICHLVDVFGFTSLLNCKLHNPRGGILRDCSRGSHARIASMTISWPSRNIPQRRRAEHSSISMVVAPR